MKKRKLNAIKLFFLFATVGAFPLLYPGTQFQKGSMGVDYDRSFDVHLNEMEILSPANPPILTDKLKNYLPSSQTLQPIDPALGLEVQPDPIE